MERQKTLASNVSNVSIVWKCLKMFLNVSNVPNIESDKRKKSFTTETGGTAMISTFLLEFSSFRGSVFY